jgi:hypothetical protein
MRKICITSKLSNINPLEQTQSPCLISQYKKWRLCYTIVIQLRSERPIYIMYKYVPHNRPLYRFRRYQLNAN